MRKQKRAMIRRIRRLLMSWGVNVGDWGIEKRKQAPAAAPNVTPQSLCPGPGTGKITITPACEGETHAAEEAAVFSVLARRRCVLPGCNCGGAQSERTAVPFLNRKQAIAFAAGLAMQGWTVDVFRTVIRPADVEAKEAELHLRIKEASEGVIGYRPWQTTAIGVG
jgi:hypothetical protein